MIIGNLPLIDSLGEDDILVCSDDGQHVKRIKSKNLRGGGGKGLLYWKEDENKIYRLETNDGTTWVDNDKFGVPGKAEVIIKETFKTITDPMAHIDPETGEQHYQATIADKRWIFRRTSKKRVLGGLCAWRYWGSTEDSRMPSHMVNVGDEFEVDSVRIYLPGWALISTNREDLTYQFIEIDVGTGEETVIENIVALETKFIDPITNLEFYISGCPTPSLFEPMFVDVNYTWHGGLGWFYSPWAWMQKYPNNLIFEGSVQNTPDLPWQYDELLWELLAYGHRFPYRDDEPYYLFNLARKRLNGRYEITPSGTSVIDDGPVYLNNYTWGGRFDDLNTSWAADYWMCDIQGHEYHGLFARSAWVNMTHYIKNELDSKIYTVPLKDMRVFSYANTDQLVIPFETSIYCVTDSLDTFKWGGFDFAWLGCVDNIADIPWDGDSQTLHGRDIFHYIWHDAGIELPGYYFTAIDIGTGDDSQYAFYTGYDNSSINPEPNPKKAKFKVKRTGEVDASAYYLNGEPLEGIQTIKVETAGMGQNPFKIATITTDSQDNEIVIPRVTYDSVYDSTTGVKIGELNFGSEGNYELYSPSGGGGGGSVSISNVWEPATGYTSRKIATLTVNSIPYDLMAPDSSVSDVSVTPVYNSGTRIARISTVSTSTGTVTNSDIYIPSTDEVTMGCQTGRLTQDSVGNPLSTTGGPYTITVNGLKTTSSGSTAFKFAKGLWKFDVRLVWTLKSTEVFSAHGVENIILAVTNKTNAGVWYAGTVLPSDPKTRYFVSPMYAGESNIAIDIPLSCVLNVASTQLQAPSFTLQITHDKWSTAYEVNNIDWSVVAYKIGEYN